MHDATADVAALRAEVFRLEQLLEAVDRDRDRLRKQIGRSIDREVALERRIAQLEGEKAGLEAELRELSESALPEAVH